MINCSAIDRRSLAGRLLRLPVRALPARSVMRVRRGPARGMKWIAGSSVHGCWLGTYELEKQKSLERFICPGMTIYDIGAQVGFYTLFFSRLAGDRGKVYAFEPCAYEARFLIDHVRLNHLDNVRVVQAAVGEKRELLSKSSDRGMCEHRLGDDPDATLIVPTISLDDSGLPAPDLIKMDVEGAESAVLRGAQRTLQDAAPVLFVALHGDRQRRACATIFRDAGYSIHDPDGQLLSGAPSVDEVYALPVVANRTT